MVQLFYQEKIQTLIQSANEIINDWKESDTLMSDISTFKQYKSELKNIYNDLKKISKNLKKESLVLSN